MKFNRLYIKGNKSDFSVIRKEKLTICFVPNQLKLLGGVFNFECILVLFYKAWKWIFWRILICNAFIFINCNRDHLNCHNWGFLWVFLDFSKILNYELSHIQIMTPLWLNFNKLLFTLIWCIFLGISCEK